MYDNEVTSVKATKLRNPFKKDDRSVIRKFRDAMTDVIKKLSYYRILSFDEIDNTIVPKDSFYRPGTENLFKLILYDKIDEVANILVDDRFLVYHFNESK